MWLLSLTFLFLQEVNGSLQDGGFVHLAGVTLALQHHTQLFNENIELVSSLLLWFITGCPAEKVREMDKKHALKINVILWCTTSCKLTKMCFSVLLMLQKKKFSHNNNNKMSWPFAFVAVLGVKAKKVLKLWYFFSPIKNPFNPINYLQLSLLSFFLSQTLFLKGNLLLNESVKSF